MRVGKEIRGRPVNILFAVLCCKSRRGLPDAQLATWAKGLDNFMVFLGGEPYHDLRPHEYDLGVPDDYRNLPLKLKAACRWALAMRYDYMVKADDDTYMRPERVMPLCNVDWRGRPNQRDGVQFASGGPGYILSAKAMAIVASAAFPDGEWAEDWCVGWAMSRAGVPLTPDERFRLVMPYEVGIGTPMPHNEIVSACEFKNRMFEPHDAWMAGEGRRNTLLTSVLLR